MRLAIIIGIALLALAFAVVNGILMCVSPRHHAMFWRWYTRVADHASAIDPGAQVQLRIAGLVIVAVSIFLAWVLTGKVFIR